MYVVVGESKGVGDLRDAWSESSMARVAGGGSRSEGMLVVSRPNFVDILGVVKPILIRR